MSHIIIWIIALILLVPTYGISILIAIVLSVVINKTSSSGFSGGSMEYQMNQAYLAFCKAEYGETFNSWQYNGFKLTKVIEFFLQNAIINVITDWRLLCLFLQSIGLEHPDVR